MELNEKRRSKITSSKLFAFLDATAKLEEEIDIASKILLKIKNDNSLNRKDYFESPLMATSYENPQISRPTFK